ncbi:YiiX/YebB-like N1pC/P60 family cysteine hydrolase [Andreprevotia chitinilytica]|uniref:YiiX/YebB-like N1pC/P60 family cysteine hydrolase n=1 Tax=Andreprevotia chitinilytica TaxID=396808 RepID=UPI0012EC57FF|nr:YiiX/YebB-like N1pC/P60 family cysteine hydrolase [Andreprevotia chitinilytica]
MFRPLLLSTVLLAAALTGCAVHPMQQKIAESATSAAMLDAIMRLGKQGDWLAIRGLHETDNLVATVTNMPLSHAAILDLEKQQVIEAEGIGIHTTPLADFTAKSERLLLIHPVWATEEKAHAAVIQARELVGKQYNYLGLLGFNVPDRYYCTELAMVVYKPYPSLPNPIPPVIEPGQLWHWGTVIYDSGPVLPR